jgi:hypothetical protein
MRKIFAETCSLQIVEALRRRAVGKPRGRWIDAVDRDAKRMFKCKNRGRSAEDRGAWRRRIERPRPKLGCSAIGEKD